MSWSLSGWRRWLIAALACCITIAAAYAMPVREAETVVTVRSALVDELSMDVAAVAAREDLGSILASRRWGNSQPPSTTAAEPTALEPVPTFNPELLKMNFVGLITVQDQRTVLLTVPSVGVERFVAGDELPDGRILVSVTDNSLTIKAEGLPEEELLLFPSMANDAGRPVEDEAQGQGGEALR